MSSYRSYVPWSKSNLSSSYSGSGSSTYTGIPKSSDTTTTKPATTDNKYDSGSVARRYGTSTSIPSSSTGTSTSSYRSTYVPAERSTAPSKYGTSTTSSSSYLNKDKSTTPAATSTPTKDTKENDRPSIREKYNMGPALPSTPSTTTTTTTKEASDKPVVRDRYGVREDRQSLLDKYSSGGYSSRGSDASRSYSLGTPEKKEEPTSSYTSRSLSRSSAPKPEPEPEKTSGYNSLSPYRLYGGRTSSSYSRTNSKDTDNSSATSSPATTPVNNPTSLRYGTTSRFIGSTPRSPVNENVTRVTSPVADNKSYRFSRSDEKAKEAESHKTVEEPKAEVEMKSVAVVTRGTSPTPPSTSSFLRTRRADLARVIEKTIQRPVVRPEMVDKEIQSDRGDDTARLSRFGSTSRSTVSPWTSYLDRLSTSATGYSPTVAKYSTRGYSYTRDRDATVSTSPGCTSPPSGATSPTPVAMAPIDTPASMTAKDPPKEIPKTTESKPPFVKKEEETSLKNISLTTKTNDLGLKKTASVTKVNDLGLKKSPSITKVNELGLKKTPSVTKVNELGLKKTSSITKLNEVGLNKTPSTKKDDINDKISPSTPTTANTSATKSGTIETDKEVPEKLKPAVRKSSVASNTEIAGKIAPKDSSKPGDVVLKKPDNSTMKTVDSDQQKQVTVKPDPSPVKEAALPSVKEPEKKDESPTPEDITVLKGALAGLIRANSTKRPKKLIKADSMSESETETQSAKATSPVKKTLRVKTLIKAESLSESESDQTKSPASPADQPIAAKTKLKSDSVSESETDQSKSTSSPATKPPAKLKLKSESVSESETDQSKSISSAATKPLAAKLKSESVSGSESDATKSPVTKPKTKLKTDSVSESETDQSKSVSSAATKPTAAKLKLKSESVSESESDQTKSPATKPKTKLKTDSVSESETDQTKSPATKPKTKLRTDSLSESETDQSKSVSSAATKPTAAKLKLKSESVSESESDQTKSSVSSSAKDPAATKSINKTDSLSGSESENQKTKSSTPSSPAEGGKLKTPPQSPSPSFKITSPSANRKFLPPPVPKPDGIKPSNSQHSLNKDFRKSALNMDATNSTDVEELQKQQEKQRKLAMKQSKSASGSTDVSETETSEVADVPSKIETSKPNDSLKSNCSSPSSKLKPSSSLKTITLQVPTIPGQPPARRSRSPSESSSEESDSSESEASSSSEDEDVSHSRSSASNLIFSSKSPLPFDKSKSLLTAASSKCLASSADESSITDKPPRPPSSPKPKEEAKSFLMRALAPVTNLFKSKTQEHDSSNENISNISEGLHRTESSQSISKSTSDKDDSKKMESEPKKKHRIKRMESGERAWWLDSSSNIPEGVQRIKSSKSISKMSSDSEPESKISDKSLRKHRLRHMESGDRSAWLESQDSIPEDEESKPSTKPKKQIEEHKKMHKIRKQESGERAWWLDSNPNIPEGIERMKSNSSINKQLLESDKESDKGDDRKKILIRKQESGERAWWLDSNPNIPAGIERMKSNASVNKVLESDKESDKGDDRKKILIRKQESGERAWWLDSNPNIPAGIERIKSNASVNKELESDKESSHSESRRINRLRKQESGERAWWLESNPNIPEGVQRILSSSSISKSSDPPSHSEEKPKKFSIRHQESGDKAWWMNSSSSNVPDGVRITSNGKRNDSSDDSDESESSEDDEEDKKDSVPKFPLEIPSIIEPTTQTTSTDATGRTSPYDNVDEKTSRGRKKRAKGQPLFISNHTNIDDILGTAATLVEPVAGVRKRRSRQAQADESDGDDVGGVGVEEVGVGDVRVHDSTAQTPVIERRRDPTSDSPRRRSQDATKLDDAALQVYKDGDYGSYLDLEASIDEQPEEFDGFQQSRKNSIVLRTQLSVRVHTIIEKLLNSEGRELRRALFSLKQIFQEDKDLVHEFVQNDGLACLIKVGSEADQNYQNYILRALGQVMLYVDGMNGVVDHNRTVQWLYTLISSKFRLVVKTALKLLLVFVEYADDNCMLLIKAVNAVDSAQGLHSWTNVMRLIKDYDSADTELLIYATTLINKTLNGVPDQDTYYDQVDALEEQGVEGAIQRYMSKQGTDLDLLRQFQIYEAVLHHEDGEEKGTPLRQLDDTIRKTLRNRKSPGDLLTLERRKSRRHSTGTSPLTPSKPALRVNHTPTTPTTPGGGGDDDETGGSSSSRGSPSPGETPQLNGTYKEKQTGDAGVTPGLRRRRERAERQRSFIKEQQETAAQMRAAMGLSQEDADDENDVNARLNGSDGSNKLNRVSSRKDLTPLLNAVNKLDSVDADAKSPEVNGILKAPWSRDADEDLMQLKRENTVKDLTQKLASQNILNSPEDKVINRIGDMSGLISKAKEGLAKSKSKTEVLKSPSGDVLKLLETKKSETELHWEELVSGMTRPLSICDLDFTDLKSDDEDDVLSPANITNGIPPPPPPAPMSPAMKDGPPPPPPNRLGSFVPPPPCPTTPTGFGVNLKHQRSGTATSPTKATPPTPSKTKKTVKLFWKEVRDDAMMPRQHKGPMIWDELSPVEVDTSKLEHLFESRAKDLITKKQQEMNKTKEIIVLDHKRSNAINIGMTKLPPPRSIKTAIMKMDATIMTREGIEKLLLMLPTEDEQSRIQEAQLANPDMPLGSAEQFLLTLASISELAARLKLWAFKLDYENSEKEIADPLMDLKQGVETLRLNKTFRGILSTLLSIGIFLNGNEVKGFQIEYLAKVPEVKDTVHKHSLLHHLCHMVMEKFPDATDLYSEIGAVTRASKVDFDELAGNINKMEQECKASWDHLKDIAKHDGSTMMKVKMSDFLADCAERIIVLGIVHRRVMCRYHKFLLWLGIPIFRVGDMKPAEFCRIVSEFALEYRTTRERVLQQLEKKANHRERNKTRGKMITEFGKFRTKEDRADAELRQLLGTPVNHHASDLSDAESVVHGSLPWRRQRRDAGSRTVLGPLIRDDAVNGNMTDGDDEILESLVKTATKAPGTRTMPRERKRTRHADRKSLRRTLKNGLTEEDKQHLAALIKGY